MIQKINVKSIVNKENIPYVLVKYEDTEGTLSISDARARAIALIKAATISEQEAKLLKKLSPLPDKGFGKPSKKDQEMFAGYLYSIRACRPQLKHPDINPIFGFNSRLALVDYQILNVKLQLQVHEAMHHAQCLLECAEAAETDSFFYKFGDRLDLDRNEIELVLLEFLEIRKISYLESLL